MRTRNPKGGNTVKALLPFSTVADAECDFALKFYAEESNWDLVGNNAQESRSFYSEQLTENCSQDWSKR